MTTVSVRICTDLWAGPYVDQPGAVLLLGDRIVHLDPGQCARLAQVLNSAAVDNRPQTVDSGLGATSVTRETVVASEVQSTPRRPTAASSTPRGGSGS